MKKILALVLGLAATPCMGMTGQELQEGLKSNNTYDMALSKGFIVGAFESLVCTKQGWTYGQAWAVVGNYLKDHPDQWQLDGSQIVYNAMLPYNSCPISQILKKVERLTWK